LKDGEGSSSSDILLRLGLDLLFDFDSELKGDLFALLLGDLLLYLLFASSGCV